ncbi:hypothetical protein B0H21DRAFT_734813 [Amylocystis lapponica]|nr:hypothetical protein B0H21DRAFT_734813 [Amylocystis lapponica]
MADGVSSSLGAILAGGMVSIFFSGTVTMQVIFYAKLYSTDRLRVKAVVALIWFLDILHTWLIGTAIWDYVISTWGNSSVLYHIPWTIAATIMLTALTTFIVQCFFAYRVYTVSYKNMYMTVAIVILALVRLGAALATTAEMVILEDYRVYKEHFSWLFTFGLVASAVLDITVTTSLIYFLRLSRTGTSPMDSIIDWLTFYTVQSGFLTFITTVVTIIVWLTMSNLIGIGMHLTITKLYANAFLATLNARKTLQVKQPSKGSRHLPFTASCHSQSLSGRPGLPETENIHLATKVVLFLCMTTPPFAHGALGAHQRGRDGTQRCVRSDKIRGLIGRVSMWAEHLYLYVSEKFSWRKQTCTVHMFNVSLDIG